MVLENRETVVNAEEPEGFSRFESLSVDGPRKLERAIATLSQSLQALNRKTLFQGQSLRLLAAKLAASEPIAISPEHFTAPIHPAQYSLVELSRIDDGAVFDLSFPSPLNPTFPGWFRDLSKNGVTHCRLWERPDAIGTLVAIHGWNMGSQRINSLAFLPGHFFRLGYNVAMFELPLHGRRLEEGLLFPSMDLLLTGHAMRQAIFDLRALCGVLQGRGHRSFGVLGSSLGAYVGALWGALERLSCMVLTVPLVSLSHFTWDMMRTELTPKQIKELGISRKALAGLLSYHSPLSYGPATPDSQVMVVAGRGDTLIPKKQIALLRRRWPNAMIHWADGGHGAQLGKASPQIESFLNRVSW